MKYPFLFLIICSIFHFSCTMLNNENKDKTITPNPPVELPPFEMELPEGYTIAKQASGDLNKDGAEEKVLVVNTGEMGDMGEERVILIFKVENKEWKLWHRSSGTILPSEHGGMMGDPLQSVSVEKGAIVINHFGGSRSKWDHTHRFRYQNNKWELIGVTLISGTPCVDREKFDYNLSSGRVIYSDVVQVCDQGDEPRTRSIRSKAGFVSKMESLPQMNGFVHGKIFATNPRTGNCVPKDRCYDVIDTTAGNTNENNTSTEAPISETKEEPITSPTNQPKEDLLDLKELFGIYTYSKNDQSWILTIFPEI